MISLIIGKQAVDTNIIYVQTFNEIRMRGWSPSL